MTSTDRDHSRAPETGWWQRAREAVWGTILVFLEPDTSPRCAAAAFFGFLSLFPAAGIIVFVYGLVADRAVLSDTLGNLSYVMPDIALDILQNRLTLLVGQPPATLGIGLLVSVLVGLWTGSRGIDALLFAMSRVRSKRLERGIVKTVLVSVALTIFGSIFLAVALLTVAGLPALIPFPTGEEILVLVLRWPFLFMITVAVLSALYRFGPDRRPRRWRFIWPGALVASLLWLLVGAIFSIYVENFGNFEATFGSVTATVVLMLWMYNSAQIFVLGAALNTQLEFAVDTDAKVNAEAPQLG
ncbi:MAG TPA: YihY/virulence factor BrkB family protein [Devosiaceae bacterium]|nr:YihY/virulence factor BrkB family protein [Devosiaceae bacterium]